MRIELSPGHWIITSDPEPVAIPRTIKANKPFPPNPKTNIMQAIKFLGRISWSKFHKAGVAGEFNRLPVSVRSQIMSRSDGNASDEILDELGHLGYQVQSESELFAILEDERRRTVSLVQTEEESQLPQAVAEIDRLRARLAEYEEAPF